MGRREKPVDPDAGPVQRLAHDLRTLREQAGRPTYREMARRTDYSPTALSQAAAGELLPSLAVVLAYASALDAAPEEWEQRWRDADRATRESAARDENTAPPYRGLARFEPGDQELFFGRDELVGELLELVREHRFAALFGPSGSGKSSLLRAGLIPALSQGTAPDRPAVIRILRPGERPAHTHAEALVPQDGERDTWVIVDQFEELFTLCRDRAERDRFLDLLLTAREPAGRLRVVVSVRGDFYGHCAAHRDLADAVGRASLLVGPMSPAELREVITGPAAAVGLNVERALTTRIIDEVTDRPGALPMLSHTLLETWRRRRGRTLTLAAYEETGGVQGAIAATAEELYADLSPAQARTARRILLRLIAPGDGTADTRRPAERAELDAGPGNGSAGQDASGGDVDLVVERLTAARLITLSEGTVELAHEALITGWPRLRDWIDQDRERLREQRRLDEAARTWEELDRDPGALYRGTRLDRVEELFGGAGGRPDQEGQDDDLTRPERAFLTAALAARDAEREAASRTTRRFRTLTAALSAFLVLALGAGLIAWQENRASEEEHTKTTARRIAAVAGGLRAADPRAAALLGVAAWQIAPLTESRAALLGSLAQPEVDAFTDRQTGKDTRRFLADDGRILFSSADGRVRVWDVIRGEQTDGFQLPAGTTLDGVSPDARALYVSGPDGDELWDVATRKPAVRLAQDTALADFAADGRSYLVSSLSDGGPGFVQRRRTEDGKVLFERAASGDVSQTGLGADGRLVALCPIGGTLQVWDSVSGKRRSGAWETKEVCSNASGSVRFSRDGKRLAMVSSAETRVWDLPSGRLLAELPGSGDGFLPRVEFSPDGAFLASADDTALTVWRLRDSGVLVFHRALDGEVAGHLAWTPGKRPVLRFLAGSTVRSYDLTARLAPWQATPTDAAVLSPDGGALATAARSERGGYRFELRSPSTGDVLATADLGPLKGADGDTPLLAFSPDGRALAVADTTTSGGSTRQRFTVWDVGQHAVRTSFDTPWADEHLLSGITLGPRGRTLLVSRLDDVGVVDVWDTGKDGDEEGPRKAGVLPVAVGTPSAVRPDGRLLADSADQVTELPSGTVAGRALAQGREVTALAFSPDGTRLAVGDSAGRVHLWDSDIQQRAGFLAGLSDTGEVGLRESVTALAYSADGRTLALGGTDGTLQLWDTAAQQLLAGELPTAGEEIRSLAFSRDGDTVYAASPHAPLQTYSIAPDQAVTDVCDRTGTGLTRDQWQTYVPDAPYRQVCEASESPG